jgi:peptidoglycan hydrolase-like protein with peptidoglycan-binding domain
MSYIERTAKILARQTPAQAEDVGRGTGRGETVVGRLRQENPLDGGAWERREALKNILTRIAATAALAATVFLTAGCSGGGPSQPDQPLGSADANGPRPSTSIDIAAMTPDQRVRWIQEVLGISVDGQVGPETRAAIARFQKAHGLKADGVAGPATLSALVAEHDLHPIPKPATTVPVRLKAAMKRCQAITSELMSLNAKYGVIERIVCDIGESDDGHPMRAEVTPKIYIHDSLWLNASESDRRQMMTGFEDAFDFMGNPNDPEFVGDFIVFGVESGKELGVDGYAKSLDEK